MNFYDELKMNSIDFIKDFDIKKFTTFKIGGEVDAYVEAKNYYELKIILKILKKYKKEYLIIGGLSNVLVSDKRINKVFIKLGRDFEKVFIKNNYIYAGAGIKISSFLNYTQNNNLSGLEFLAGIPGTIGGAVYMNAGAWGKEIGDYIKKVIIVTKSGRKKIIDVDRKMFKYRDSIFKKKQWIITEVVFYKFKEVSAQDIKKKIKNYLRNRKEKQPIEKKSIGSIFKNGRNYFAGELIERCGLKGYCINDACVSEKHANFIINKGSAKEHDVKKLIQIIKKKVYKKFKIKLKEEIIYIR